MTRNYTCLGCRAEYDIPAGVTVACPECGSREREARGIVTAGHADSVRITRPDGTTVQIPAACVLAADAVLRETVTPRAGLPLTVGRLEVELFAEGWLATLHHGFGPRLLEGQPSRSPWAALVSLAAELAKAEGRP